MISEKRLKELAGFFILKKKESEGVLITPSTVKLSISIEAEKLGIDVVEMAEVTKLIYQHIFAKAMEELDSIIESSEERKQGEKIS